MQGHLLPTSHTFSSNKEVRPEGLRGMHTDRLAADELVAFYDAESVSKPIDRTAAQDLYNFNFQIP